MSRGAEYQDITDESYLDFEAPQRRATKTRPGSRAPWPEARIVRGVSIDAGDNLELQGLVNVLGRRNHGKGKAFALGSMMMTMVSGTEMGRMLQAQYPKVYENRRKTIQLQRRLARKYQNFVQSSRTNIDNDVFADLTVGFEIEDIDEPELEAPSWKPTIVDDASWAEASFSVRRFHPYASNHLGLDMSTNEALVNEVNATLAFLRSEQLDTTIVDSERTPHLVVFETFGALGATGLQGTYAPGSVMLEAPRMLVNSNEPAEQGNNLL